jgi:superfamily I DNA/RNA helicase
MPRTAPAEWLPVGIDDLEPLAWEALRHDASACVVAGPGAGKTEFLAQRACYLLETGICPPPQEILAISFKRDAAVNLARRVEIRAQKDSARFVSMTFDAFTKSIVDRFRASLPDFWKLRGTYEITFPTRNEISYFLDTAANSSEEFGVEVQGIPRDRFLSAVLGNIALPLETPVPTSAEEFASFRWWREVYVEPDPQRVDFVMLNRLAELVIRANPHIQRALRLTYPFVFIDEFQDTTFAQYTFLEAVFGDGRTIVTAVGDSKQRIMGWAGALDDAFAEFRSDFDAEPFELEWNFRSSDELIAVQHVFAMALDPSSKRAVSQAPSAIDDDPAAIWRFSSVDHEARQIAEWIAADRHASGRMPSDYAIVVRQKAADFEELFTQELAHTGVRIRNDDSRVGSVTLQDLLVDELSVLLVGLVRLAASRGGNAEVWTRASDAIATLSGMDEGDNSDQFVASDELSAQIKHLRGWMHAVPPTADAVDRLVAKLLDVVDADAVARCFPSHRAPGETTRMIEAFTIRMTQASADAATWTEACNEFEGLNAVPLLTVHKSKGLEYHTVFFVGIDDKQWWSHKRDPEASTSTFFVGLSRAAQRTIFTYCSARGRRRDIADLYQLLANAGVPEYEF